MASPPVKYKKPRKINAISITLAFIALVLGWVAYQYAPFILVKQEAYRILDETASKLAARASYWKATDERMTILRGKMAGNLRLIGIRDPQMESWIDWDDANNARLGVLFSYWIEWPWDVIPRQEKVVELEYPLTLK